MTIYTVTIKTGSEEVRLLHYTELPTGMVANIFLELTTEKAISRWATVIHNMLPTESSKSWLRELPFHQVGHFVEEYLTAKPQLVDLAL